MDDRGRQGKLDEHELEINMFTQDQSNLNSSDMKRMISSGHLGQRAFTILELLFVMGILLLMLGFTIPAFFSISRGSNLRTAEREVQANLFLARQQAVTTRQRVAFCIPTKVLVANNIVRTNMILRSMVLVTEETAGVAAPSGVLGKTDTLPKGIVFKDDFSNWKDIEVRNTNNVVLFQGKVFRYAPTGAIWWKDSDGVTTTPGVEPSYNVILTEGTVSDEGVVAYNSSGNTSTCIVSMISGRCTIPR